MSIFTKISNMFESKSKTKQTQTLTVNMNNKTYDVPALVSVIQNSKDKEEIRVAVAVFLAMASVLLKKGKEQEVKDLILLTMNVVNSRKDDIFNLEDVWKVIVNVGLKDFANKVLGTQL